MKQDWKLVTHEPGRIVRYAVSDDPSWVRIQRITLRPGDDAEGAAVVTMSFHESELRRILDGVDAGGNAA